MSNENETDKPQQQPNNPEAGDAAPETQPSAAEQFTAAADAGELSPGAKAVAAKKAAAAKGEKADKAEAADKPKPVAAKAAVAKAEAPKAEAAEGEKPAAKPVPKKEEPPAPPELGKYGKMLSDKGYSPVALGNDAGGMEMVEIKAGELREACFMLRDQAQFDLLVSVAGVDWKERREVVYHLYSTKTYEVLAVKATAVDEKLPSVVPVWLTADWHERETYDLFGIVFEGHPNLQRILMPSDWIGYPMRKDYKVEDPRLVWNER